MVAGAAWDIAARVVDPEIPVLTIEDLGVLRSVEEHGDRVRVELTPTYSGCPAIDAIRDDVRTALEGAGYREVEVRMVLSPAWSTDWMSASGKAKLREFGIAPPDARAADGRTALRM
ncbi:MAG: phenylacetate-CoA oxygenase subunit PaaJ, partial [Salinibacterium sp.]|nr:phenylacetate-CoA oxygenase subunit PaaJ [Salinibacterium sp.]